MLDCSLIYPKLVAWGSKINLYQNIILPTQITSWCLLLPVSLKNYCLLSKSLTQSLPAKFRSWNSPSVRQIVRASKLKSTRSSITGGTNSSILPYYQQDGTMAMRCTLSHSLPTKKSSRRVATCLGQRSFPIMIRNCQSKFQESGIWDGARHAHLLESLFHLSIFLASHRIVTHGSSFKLHSATFRNRHAAADFSCSVLCNILHSLKRTNHIAPVAFDYDQPLKL